MSGGGRGRGKRTEEALSARRNQRTAKVPDPPSAPVPRQRRAQHEAQRDQHQERPRRHQERAEPGVAAVRVEPASEEAAGIRSVPATRHADAAAVKRKRRVSPATPRYHGALNACNDSSTTPSAAKPKSAAA